MVVDTAVVNLGTLLTVIENFTESGITPPSKHDRESESDVAFLLIMIYF